MIRSTKGAIITTYYLLPGIIILVSILLLLLQLLVVGVRVRVGGKKGGQKFSWSMGLPS